MNINKRLKELEDKQREIADEIKELRREHKEFKPGKFYKSNSDDEIILCVHGEPRDDMCFCGVSVDNARVNDDINDAWNKSAFHEVKPIWVKV
jgi:hypothetical protein